MKNQDPQNPNRKENSPIAITATLAEKRLLKNLVEKLADRRYDTGQNLEKAQPGWQITESSSIEAYVSGDLGVSEQTSVAKVSFITCFLFTCIKGKGSKYNLTWASSLS